MAFSPVSTRAFIQSVIADAREGQAFVPLIGSGFSAPSGILMGQEFTEYLAYTAYSVLRPTPDRRDLRSKGWPPYPNADDVSKTQSWIAREFGRICKAIDDSGTLSVDKVKSSPPVLSTAGTTLSDMAFAFRRPMIPTILRSPHADNTVELTRRLLRVLGKGEELLSLPHASNSPTSDEYIIESGIRSLYDWRATLNFLSRVVVQDGPPRQGKAFCPLRLDSCDGTVIDRFNTYITRDRQPNLGHKMLVRVDGSLTQPGQFRTTGLAVFGKGHHAAQPSRY